MGVNSLPKTVSRQRRGCDLNPGPSATESSTLTTRLPSHPNTDGYIMYYAILQYKVSLLLTDLVVAFVLFTFMLVYCCVFVSLPFLYILYKERKCADTIVPDADPWAGHFQC